MEGIHLRFEITLKQFLEDLTQAVYKIALEYRAGGTFIELQLELWNALRKSESLDGYLFAQRITSGFLYPRFRMRDVRRFCTVERSLIDFPPLKKGISSLAKFFLLSFF